MSQSPIIDHVIEIDSIEFSVAMGDSRDELEFEIVRVFDVLEQCDMPECDMPAPLDFYYPLVAVRIESILESNQVDDEFGRAADAYEDSQY